MANNNTIKKTYITLKKNQDIGGAFNDVLKEKYKNTPNFIEYNQLEDSYIVHENSCTIMSYLMEPEDIVEITGTNKKIKETRQILEEKLENWKLKKFKEDSEE
jgi:hypothetical protein